MKHFILLLLLFPLFTYAQDFPRKPTSYVTAYDPSYVKNSILKQEEEELLNAKLRAFQGSTGIQVLVYLTQIGSEPTQEYSQKLFDTWGVGEKGAIICIFTFDRKFTLVGRGLEAALPYEICMEVLDEEMTPHLQDKNFYKGVDAGINRLIYYSKHSYEPPNLIQKIKKNIFTIIGISALVLPFVIGLLLKIKRRNT